MNPSEKQKQSHLEKSLNKHRVPTIAVSDYVKMSSEQIAQSKKFIKDFDIKYGMPDLGTSNFTFDSSTITYQTAAVSLETNYGSRIDNFTVNGVGDNGTDDGGDNEYGGIAIGLNTEILNDIFESAINTVSRNISRNVPRVLRNL